MCAIQMQLVEDEGSPVQTQADIAVGLTGISFTTKQSDVAFSHAKPTCTFTAFLPSISFDIQVAN